MTQVVKKRRNNYTSADGTWSRGLSFDNISSYKIHKKRIKFDRGTNQNSTTDPSDLWDLSDLLDSSVLLDSSNSSDSSDSSDSFEQIT